MNCFPKKEIFTPKQMWGRSFIIHLLDVFPHQLPVNVRFHLVLLSLSLPPFLHVPPFFTFSYCFKGAQVQWKHSEWHTFLSYSVLASLPSVFSLPVTSSLLLLLPLTNDTSVDSSWRKIYLPMLLSHAKLRSKCGQDSCIICHVPLDAAEARLLKEQPWTSHILLSRESTGNCFQESSSNTKIYWCSSHLHKTA